MHATKADSHPAIDRTRSKGQGLGGLFQQFGHCHCRHGCDGWHGDVPEDGERVRGDGRFALVQGLDDHLPRVAIGIASDRQQGNDVFLPNNATQSF